MNSSYTSLIAIAVSIFFSGVYLRGESVRKKEIKKEIELIKQKQEEILKQVHQINAEALAKDQQLLAQIDSTQAIILELNEEETLSRDRISAISSSIQHIQTDIDSSRKEMRKMGKGGFQFSSPSPTSSPPIAPQ